MDGDREVLVVCSDRRMAIGMTVWDVETAEKILHIPTCAAAVHGLIRLRNHHLVASQVHRLGSIGSSSIFIWSLHRPHSPIRSYTIEVVGPLCSTRDGAYLAGGAASGNIYLWEVASGRLLKSWPAHHKAVKCMTFSDDGSFLISGSDDGMICLWSTISLLDVEDSRGFSALLHCSSEHTSALTSLLTLSPSACLKFISSSLDGTCRIWDLICGRLIKTMVYGQGVTAVALHPFGQFIFSGTEEGNIFVDLIDSAGNQDPYTDKQDRPTVLKGHKEAITALSFSKSGLISASKDCTVCLWNISSRSIIRRFDHQKGPVTNLVIIPHSSLVSQPYSARGAGQNRVSLLEKYPQPLNGMNEMVIRRQVSRLENYQSPIDFQRSRLLHKQILTPEQEESGSAMEMKVETAVSCRRWAMNMTKHVVDMNKHIQSCLLEMMQLRLCPEDTNSASATANGNKKKIMVHQEGLPIEIEDQSQNGKKKKMKMIRVYQGLPIERGEQSQPQIMLP